MKLILLIAVSVAMVISARAQGAVDFRNNQSNFLTTADRKVYEIDGTTPLVGTNFLAQLYYNVGFDMNDPAIMISVTNPPVTFREPGTPLPGTWMGGGSRNLIGVAAGTSTAAGGFATLQVRVWDVRLGNTWEESRLALMQGATGSYGMSAPFNYQVPLIGPPNSAWYMDNLRSFSLVPEPSALSLGFLSALLLLLQLRRRNSSTGSR